LKLFGFLAGSLDALGADLLSLTVNFLCLQIDGEFSSSGDIGMTPSVSGSSSAVAYLANSAHIS
jgi:hypothetical protein